MKAYYEPSEMAFAAKLAEFIQREQPQIAGYEFVVEFRYGGEPTGVGVGLQGDKVSYAVTIA